MVLWCCGALWCAAVWWCAAVVIRAIPPAIERRGRFRCSAGRRIFSDRDSHIRISSALWAADVAPFTPDRVPYEPLVGVDACQCRK